MVAVPRYAKRFARVPQALALLRAAPEGLDLAGLAARVSAPEDELREELLAFFTAEVGLGGTDPGFRGGHLEFLGPDGGDADASAATVVRLTDEAALTELGVEVFGPEVLAPLLAAAYDLLATEPHNVALAGAVAALESGLVSGVTAVPRDGAATAGLLRTAAATRRRVRLVYARTWRPGVVDRVIEPYRVVSTVRGYEVDAGPLDADGAIRTYLVSGIHEAEVLDETFQRPADAASRIAAARSETPVDLVVPQRSRWAVDLMAERVEVLAEDEDDVALRAWLLPPLVDRVGQVLVLAGPDAYVTAPADLQDAGSDLARRLLAHHGLE
jgi:predicted DNA-binding transcriptional regulator YafY